MFEVKDKLNKTLFIHDKILHVIEGSLEDTTTQGIIISFPEEGMVQYEPIGKGLPVICGSTEITQVDSLAQRALALRTNEDFQQLIIDAQERFALAVKQTKKKKAGTRGGQTPSTPSISEKEVAELGVDLDNI